MSFINFPQATSPAIGSQASTEALTWGIQVTALTGSSEPTIVSATLTNAANGQPVTLADAAVTYQDPDTMIWYVNQTIPAGTLKPGSNTSASKYDLNIIVSPSDAVDGVPAYLTVLQIVCPR